jgi:predicted Zn-dependent protease
MDPNLNSLSTDLRRAYETLASDAAAAETQAKAILNSVRNNPDAEMIRAGARRRQGFAGEARTRLRRLAKAHPDHANIQHELGEALAALGQTDQAITALRHAVALQPKMTTAWRTLADQLFMAGAVAAANEAYRSYINAPLAEPWLEQASKALLSGELQVARPLLEDHLKQFPSDIVALAMLADLHLKQERYSQAEPLLLACLERHPDHYAMRLGLAYALIRQKKRLADAVADLALLTTTNPADFDALALLAEGFSAVGNHARAIEVYKRLSDVNPGDPQFWCSYALELKSVGRRKEAVAALKQALAISPGYGVAWFELSNFKTYIFTEDEQTAMRGLLNGSALGLRERIHIHYALAKAGEDGGDYAEAFANYAAGSKLRRMLLPYDAAVLPEMVARSKVLFTPQFFAARAGGGLPDSAPIFIVGLPRSGSTLLEQILASHPAVEGTAELVYINDLVQRLKAAFPNDSYPNFLGRLSRSDCVALGKEYLTAAGTHRNLDRPYFIDKMPLNFQHIGLIHCLLPRSRIIDMRRHPMASGFAAFKQHFGRGWAFSYDLTDIGHYYRAYIDLMSVINCALPGRVHRVLYDDLVNDTEAEIRRVLDYCGLTFDEACLRFHETERAVMTPSAEQVRRPIFREGLSQWQAFQTWLEPLKVTLGDALETWRD